MKKLHLLVLGALVGVAFSVPGVSSAWWDFSTYDSVQGGYGYYGSQSSVVRDVYVRDDGARLYTLASDKVNDYSLLSSYDVTTMSYSTSSLNFSTLLGEIVILTGGFDFSDDGTKMYVSWCSNDSGNCGSFSNKKITQFDLAAPWFLGSGVTVGLTDNQGPMAAQFFITALDIFDSGSKVIFTTGSAFGNQKIQQCTLSTPWVWSSKTGCADYDMSNFAETGTGGSLNAVSGLRVSDDGRKLYISREGSANATLYQYNLSTANSVAGGGSLEYSVDRTNSDNGATYGFSLVADGVYFEGSVNKRIYQDYVFETSSLSLYYPVNGTTIGEFGLFRVLVPREIMLDRYRLYVDYGTVSGNYAYADSSLLPFMSVDEDLYIEVNKTRSIATAATTTWYARPRIVLLDEDLNDVSDVYTGTEISFNVASYSNSQYGYSSIYGYDVPFNPGVVGFGSTTVPFDCSDGVDGWFCRGLMALFVPTDCVRLTTTGMMVCPSMQRFVTLGRSLETKVPWGYVGVIRVAYEDFASTSQATTTSDFALMTDFVQIVPSAFVELFKLFIATLVWIAVLIGSALLVKWIF